MASVLIRRWWYRNTEVKTLWKYRGMMAMSNQREKPQKKPTLPTLWSQTSDLQNCEKIHFCCFTIQCLSYCIPSKPTQLVLIKHLNLKKKTGIYLLINGNKHIFQDQIKYLELDQARGCSVHQLTYINWVTTRNKIFFPDPRHNESESRF